MFRLVERPVIRPMHCAALPQLGQTAKGERWVDTGAELPGFDNHVYLSETAVREAGRLLGFAAQTEVDELREANEMLYAALDTAQRENNRLSEALMASKVIETYVDSITEPVEEKPDGSE